MSAVNDLRVMADRIIRFVADRGERWQDEGTPDRLLLNAATLMRGVANGLEASSIDLVRGDEAG